MDRQQAKQKQKERIVQLLGEVKFAEKQLEKAKAALPSLEAKTKQALLGGNRDLALKFAVQMEEQKGEVAALEKRLVIAKHTLQKAKEQGAELDDALAKKELLDGLGAMAKLMDKAEGADDMLRKLERETAIDEAKSEMAFEEAQLAAQIEPAISPAEAILRELEAQSQPPSQAPKQSAEDILKEFEGGA